MFMYSSYVISSFLITILKRERERYSISFRRIGIAVFGENIINCISSRLDLWWKLIFRSLGLTEASLLIVQHLFLYRFFAFLKKLFSIFITFVHSFFGLSFTDSSHPRSKTPIASPAIISILNIYLTTKRNISSSIRKYFPTFSSK